MTIGNRQFLSVDPKDHTPVQLCADPKLPQPPAVTVPALRTASLSLTGLSAFKIRYCCKMTPPTLIPFAGDVTVPSLVRAWRANDNQLSLNFDDDDDDDD